MSLSSKILYPMFMASVSSLKSKAILASVGFVVMNSATAWADGNKKEEQRPRARLSTEKDEKKPKVEELVPEQLKSPSLAVKNVFESGLPYQVSYGFMMGYSSGFCLKKVSKVGAFMLGGVFILIQTLSYKGYINVHYEKIQMEVESLMDLNHDGKVDQADFEYGMKHIKDILGYQMPAGGGFGAGLVMGLRG